ncbi:nickel pincer cofactor biosynthesis protein LarB [Marinivivus vitaminiproducens]|uniref:nickel pincer cofactor biosynthesis protein LarB n=1 Tax=Marinivivus vitaminiproducens TaxID=3035935 RepID=UPI0027A4FA3D|nr:nickel pincer cofactor biosynthesis protein LarB [Geminicoccaceae bacterium SCSIO 64248]
MADFRIDWQRGERTGFPEAVLCEHKAPAQIDAIVAEGQARGERLLLTRLTPERHAALALATRAHLRYRPESRTAVLGEPLVLAECGVGIVTAGTSDLPIAHEAAETLAFVGKDAAIVADIGVAGLWRLMDRIEDIRRFRVVIAIAGMEGALFGVLPGLIAAPVIAVPSSAGYGVATNGRAALSSALASCAPGLATVNVDNGFGAAVMALKILRAAS